MLKTKLLLIVLTAMLFTGCCLEDHTKSIEKVAEPMLKELEAFYKTNKRFPNTKERDVMLEKSGCKMKGDICMFEGEELIIAISEVRGTDRYFMRIEYQDKETRYSMASCGFNIYNSNEKDFIICSRRPCLQIRQ